MDTPITDTALSKDDKELEKQRQQGLPGSSQTSATSPTSRVASFSSGQQAPGSGRFTNIQNYLNANKQASGNLGAKAADKINTGFNQQQSQVDDQNKNLATQFGQGQQQLKAGGAFQKELTGINENLNTGFKSMEDRDLFDTTGQRVSSFTQSGLQQTPETQGLDTSFQNYQNLASGKGIDEQMLNQNQQQALSAAQGLQTTSQENLRGVETESGRDKLFSQVLQPKQGYTSGQRSFDKLFLGGALPSIKSNLQDKTNLANELTGRTSGQQKTIEELIAGEQGLLNEQTGLLGLAKQGQDSFTNKLGQKENIDFIQKLRNERYNQALGEIKSGNIGSTLAETLGLGGVSTFGGNPVANKSVSQKTTPNDVRQLTSYNADLSNTGGSFIDQGKAVKSIQDITSDQDYGVYQALQKLALGRDTGVLSGASDLGGAVTKNAQGKTLSDLITEQDNAFRKDYANKNVRTEGFGSQDANSVATLFGARPTSVTKRGGSITQTTVGDDPSSKFYDYYNTNRPEIGAMVPQTGQNSDGYIWADSENLVPYNDASFSGSSTAKIGDYLADSKIGTTSNYNSTVDGNEHGERAREELKARTEAETKAKLEEIIGQTGARNKLNIKDDSNTEAAKLRDKFKRFV